MGHQVLPRDAPREAAVSAAIDRRRALALLGAPLAVALAPSARAAALDSVRQRGHLTVAVYNDLPPFNVGGQGIDVDLARALAKGLGVELSLLPFTADENMGDDLRNMVWKGHYLGYGPADVLLHVPVDRPLMQDNPKVTIFAPYYRERLMLARDVAQVPTMESLASFGGRPIAVAGQSLSGWLLLGADEGRWRGQLLTSSKDGCEAAKALVRGEAAGAAGTASELESVLGGDARFAIEPLPLPRARDGWAVGCAVRRESGDLAQALQAAMNQLATSGELGRMFASRKVAWRAP